MRYLIALLLFTSTVLADGVVLFNKSTGVLYGSDNGTYVFKKIQPKETVADGNAVLGAQIEPNVNWAIYDLASFKQRSVEPPQTTNDLTDVVPFNVYSNQQAKVNNRNKYENQYFALVKAVLKLADDPRQYIVPTPKIDRDELQAMLDAMYEVPSTEKKANKLASQLLSTDAALMKYNLNWWDTATTH